ncbi:MAG TPA: bacillithiol biosynthesis BshC, partial [Candidatus Kapabacteria bacterium]|nr:bacillithiol biosynthesis BshC [Candidatus Kapabacteria bacterium]
MKGFSNLFSDLLQSAPYISSRFPTLDDTFENYMRNKALRCDREKLTQVLQASLSHLDLTEKQQHNLHLAGLQNTMAVVTGQQVGFLGGPLYTLYKAYSAIAQAEKLQAQYQSFNVIPLFWIEDNDHDRNEAAEAYILDKQGMPQQIICPADTTLSVQTPVSELSITDDISAVLTALEQHLPENEYTRDLMPLLHTIYTVGTEWSVAFMRLLQHWCGEKGLLFVRASDIRKSGAFASIVKQELAHPMRILETVQKVNNELRNNGYTPQVEPSAVNLFYHDG